MATIVLSAAGAALGSSLGGSFLGLSLATLGQFAGASLGYGIDQKLLGAGSDAIEHGRIDRYRIMSAAEGTPIPRVYGKLRVAGQLIWSTRFEEVITTSQQSSGGKGSVRSSRTVKQISYTVSIAVAVCEGEISRIGTIWADGQELETADLNMQVYLGTRTQLADPLMVAFERRQNVPAYRGVAYVVFEDLPLEAFGNRIPQFSFEVERAVAQDVAGAKGNLKDLVRAVALLPGGGEYALATEPVYYRNELGQVRAANLSTPALQPDFKVSRAQLGASLSRCRRVSLVLSWFGDDLRCNHCQVSPMVEQRSPDADMPWQVAGRTRQNARVLPQLHGRAIYPGTPTDESVVQALRELRHRNMRAMIYPTLLMIQLPDNRRPDPWSHAPHQPSLPWRGRITVSKAPGRAGSPEGSRGAHDEIDRFFGTAQAQHFSVSAGKVQYQGPGEWSYNRFILHYAALCKAAGGVAAFCLGSELRGLTQVRGEKGAFPAVDRLIRLLEELRSLLGAETKIGYAADWKEYGAYRPAQGAGDVFFNLDPLWSHKALDFVGISNYMPLADWRDGFEHRDASWGSIYNLAYLKSNIAGGEGFDWFYASKADRDAQRRRPIADPAHNEPWVFRDKDLLNWWRKPHHERHQGARQAQPTAWKPSSRPIWFTEIGCAAIDKGANQPDKLYDPRSAESGLPHYSNGLRDDFIQWQYLRAQLEYWRNPAHNPVSSQYRAPMVALDHAYVWNWDTRPYPSFLSGASRNRGGNHPRGHWIGGRTSGCTLASVVAEICTQAGVLSFDVSGLYGMVRGFVVSSVQSGRATLQSLMLYHGFDAIERNGTLSFVMRGLQRATAVEPGFLAVAEETKGAVEKTRAPDAELSGRVRLRFIAADGSFEPGVEEAVLPDEATHAVSEHEAPMVMTRAEARMAAERWLAESRLAREKVRLALPPSRLSVGVGDLIALPAAGDAGKELYRVDRLTQGHMQLLEATRVDLASYQPIHFVDEDIVPLRPYVAPTPLVPLFLDLPLISGDETPHAPYIAVSTWVWPGSLSLYESATGAQYRLNISYVRRAVIGYTQTPLVAAPAGLFDKGAALDVRLIWGTLESVSQQDLLDGANLAAIGHGGPYGWELFQFQRAELIGAQTYRLTMRLRGQLGSDSVMPRVWPKGRFFVLIDDDLQQIALSSSQRNHRRHYRVGPAARPYTDHSYRHRVHAFRGIGLRPYAPVHLRMEKETAGGRVFRWIRRTRIDGDNWELPDVPIGEEVERYTVQVMHGDTLLRVREVGRPYWHYDTAAQAEDQAAGKTLSLRVAQVSARYGNGFYARLAFDL
ncbi:MAG: glycoside hydrolase/phage tail family protein [Rhodobacteraceae bacterium]|nr:glycoside hydrolase/phage tail family protein [Paracoccaceae bacterium]